MIRAFTDKSNVVILLIGLFAGINLINLTYAGAQQLNDNSQKRKRIYGNITAKGKRLD